MQWQSLGVVLNFNPAIRQRARASSAQAASYSHVYGTIRPLLGGTKCPHTQGLLRCGLVPFPAAGQPPLLRSRLMPRPGKTL